MRIFVYLFIINILAVKLTGKYCRYELEGVNEGNVIRKKWISILSVLGGAYGKYLAIWMNDKKRLKEKPLETIFDICLVAVQFYALVFFVGVNDFTPKHTMQELVREVVCLGIFVGIISSIAFMVYMILAAKTDSVSAKRKIVLIIFSIIGGDTGELLAMYISGTKDKIEWLGEGLKIIWITKTIAFIFITLRYMYI